VTVNRSELRRLLDEVDRTIQVRVEAAEDFATVVATGERSMAGRTRDDLELRSRRTALDLAAAQQALREALAAP
jgi:hypothetical protein